MTASHARKPLAANAIASRAAAALSATAAKLSAEQQRRLLAHKAALPELVAKVIAQLDGPPATPGRTTLTPRGPAEVLNGEGLKDPLPPGEGERRLHAYATPTALEDWAGPVAGPVEIQRQLRIARSTLHAWQSKGLVIGLVDGVRKTVYPLEQFAGGKPVPGLADVLAVIGHPSVAWGWLKEPNPVLNGTAPLDLLKRGRLEVVLEAAQTNFDQ